MAKNLLVINCDIRETRVALIENGIIAELHLERDSQVGTLGNIYLGKVSRVLPGMQAAFIDIGLERAAFLHVEDLIRPDDFEAYLAGHRTAMGGAQEAKTDDGSDAPSEEEANVASGGAAPAPAAPAAAHAPGVSRGGTTTPQGTPRPGQEEGGERRGRRRRRGRGRRNGGEGPRPGEGLAGEAGEAGASAAPGALEGDDEAPEGDEPESLLDPSFEGEGESPVAASDEGEASAEAPAARPAPAASASSGPPSAGGPRAWSLLDPAREPRTEAAPAASVDHVEGGPERPAATEAEPVAEAGPAPAVPATDEDAPTPSRRRRSRKSRSTTREAEVEVEAPRSEAPASIDALAAELATAGAAPTGDDDHASLTDEGAADEAGAEGQEAEEGGEALDDEGAGEPPAEAGSAEDAAGTRARRSRRGRARTRRSGSTAERREKMAAVVAAPPTPSSQRKAKAEPLRVSKSTPIREVVREGQEVIVQVSKEPIGTKGARVTSHVSLPGRYVVYLPTVEHVGISKRIGSDKERSRLRAAIDAMKPPTGGLIVRTLAEGLTKKDLKNDVGYLVRLWGEVIKKREASTRRAPDCLYTELDIVLRAARDLFTDDIEKIIIDDRQQYERLKRFIEMFMPERADAIELYEGGEPIFDEYGIEEEIGRALARKVPLESGGYLIIDQAEALTAIDVNTGKFVGKGSTDLEDTILKTNLEAVQEIAYQLRFRNLGGLIVLDLIDMEKAANREKVRRRLEELLAKDKAKTTLNRISDLGLIEMTRKRTRESLSRTMNEPCFYCDGTGNLQSKQTIAYEILRQIKRERANLRGYVVMVNAHPAVVDLLKHEERAAVIEAERRYQRRIDLVPRKEYHLEQFDLVGR